jgi:hypothetical protein
MMPDRAAVVALVLGNLAGLTAAFLLVASCGADVYQESLMRYRAAQFNWRFKSAPFQSHVRNGRCKTPSLAIRGALSA